MWCAQPPKTYVILLSTYVKSTSIQTHFTIHLQRQIQIKTETKADSHPAIRKQINFHKIKFYDRHSHGIVITFAGKAGRPNKCRNEKKNEGKLPRCLLDLFFFLFISTHNSCREQELWPAYANLCPDRDSDGSRNWLKNYGGILIESWTMVFTQSLELWWKFEKHLCAIWDDPNKKGTTESKFSVPANTSNHKRRWHRNGPVKMNYTI